MTIVMAVQAIPKHGWPQKDVSEARPSAEQSNQGIPRLVMVVDDREAGWGKSGRVDTVERSKAAGALDQKRRGSKAAAFLPFF
jgi:hypothetical protein